MSNLICNQAIPVMSLMNLLFESMAFLPSQKEETKESRHEEDCLKVHGIYTRWRVSEEYWDNWVQITIRSRPLDASNRHSNLVKAA